MDGNTADEPSPALSAHRNPDGNDEANALFQATDEDALQAKRLLYVETLLRKHLKFITYPVPGRPVLEYEEAYGLRRVLLRREADLLDATGDTIAGTLITAALNVVDSAADGDETAVVDQFLLSTVSSMLIDGPARATEFLYPVLGELTQRDADNGDNQSDHLDENWTPPGLPLSVLIGNETIPVDFDQILPFFWSPDERLATDCHTCALPFVAGDPPIRTINIAMSDALILQVRVFNRHFPCIRDSRIPFVPVSHVWTDSIRQANVDRAHNDAAATKLIRTLTALGRGAEDAYGPEVEFWHDYFSVPQWQAEVKEQLLVRLPAIYHLPDEILVHLQDVPASCIHSLFLNSDTETAGNDPFIQVMTVLPHIRALLGSEWMERMWVTLEYAQCRAACVMTKTGRIHRLLDHDAQTQTTAGITGRDTFSHALIVAHSYFHDLSRFASTVCNSLSHLREFLAGPRRRLSLGEAIELVASKQCQYSRDRFIALDVLLDDRQTEWLPAGDAVLPDPEAKACEHIWLKALRLGDYTPLLLQPQERISGSNPSTQSGLASWVVGHSGLEGVEWNHGGQTTTPDFVPVITDEGVIFVTLALAGEIEDICYLDVEQAGTVAGVAFALHHIYGLAKAEDMELSPELLGDGLQRIFPFPDIFGGNMNVTLIDRLSCIADAGQRDPEVADRIRHILTKYDGSADGYRTALVAHGISDELGLEAGVSGVGKVGKAFTRLWRSKGEARRREERGAKGGDPICKVRCPECRRVTPFRLDLRETGGIGQKVYRIPGLGLFGSLKDGVGLVIDEGGRITGRMFYGPPACDCRLLVEVEIH